MKKALFIITILMVSVFSTACINNLAVQELNNKAKIYMDKGDYENAISRLKSSLDLDDTIFETQYNLAVAYTYAEEYDEAIETFSSALKLNPDFADAYYSLGVAQENYAISIIKGEKKSSDEESVQEQESQQDVQYDMNNEPKLSDEDVQKVKALYTEAIKSYRTYLEKAVNPKDKATVETKIQNINTEIEKISNPDKVAEQ